jgi:hypothetical protein
VADLTVKRLAELESHGGRLVDAGRDRDLGVDACARVSTAGTPRSFAWSGAVQSSEPDRRVATQPAAGLLGERPLEEFIHQLDITPILVHSSESAGLSESVSGKEEIG